MICAAFFSQPGEGKSTATHLAEWAGLSFSLVAGFAVTTSAYMSALPPEACSGGWPFGFVDCHEQELHRKLSAFTYGVLPLTLAGLCAPVVLARATLRACAAYRQPHD